MIIKPMLAAKGIEANLAQIRFPVLCSPKMDGIRCRVGAPGVKPIALSRKLLPIPNKYVQAMLDSAYYVGTDGELIVGSPTAENVYNVTNSGVMTIGGTPDFKFYVFDVFTTLGGFHDRLTNDVRLRVDREPEGFVQAWPHVLINSVDELLGFEQGCLEKGFEGVIGRSLDGKYKSGRSTLREQGMWKLKRFVDSEAVILRVIELEHNDNVAEQDELGNTKRSSAQSGKRGGGTLGAVEVRDLYSGVEFRIGMFKGWDKNFKQSLWHIRDTLPGQVLKYSSFPIGVKDAPRHPKCLGFRSRIDMS